MLLMMFWLLGIALMLKAAGATKDDSDYDGIGSQSVFFIMTFRDSLGDISAPQY